MSLQILPFVIEVLRVLPLVTFPLVYFMKGERADDEKWVAIGVLSFFILLGALTIFSVLRTGSKNPGTLETLTRYGVASLFVESSRCAKVQRTSVNGDTSWCQRKAEFQMFNILIFQSFSKFAYCAKRVRGTTRRIENLSEKHKTSFFKRHFYFRTCYLSLVSTVVSEFNSLPC